MTIIRYGAWAPDLPRVGNTCIIAENVYSIPEGYAPFPGAGDPIATLAAPCVGVTSFTRVNGVTETFAGTATKLFRLNGSSWTDVSNGTYSTSANWRFALFGDRLVATNGVNSPQKFDLSSASAFSDLAGAPVHRFPIVIRDTLVALDVQDGSGFAIKFSAVNNSEKWTADCGGGAQAVPDGGPVVGGTGGEVGVVLQEGGLTRMDFVGGDLRFTFDKIEGSVGAVSASSIVQYKGLTFYLSEEGFNVFDGASSRNISDGAITKTFLSAVNKSLIGQVRGALDPANTSIVWAYPLAAGGTSAVIYNYSLNRWSSATLSLSCIHAGEASTGLILSGFDASNRLVRLTGSALAATLSTGDMQMFDGRRGFLRSVRGMVDAAYASTVGSKQALADAEATAVANSGADGVARTRGNARYYRFEIRPTAAWSSIVGVDVDVVEAGIR